ncbi:hypothetical protein DV737_g1403, partial [Chaetothyriales sp. CBS 132003]
MTEVSDVVDYLQNLDYVEADKIVVTGICAGGGYAVAAAKGEHPIKAGARLGCPERTICATLRKPDDKTPHDLAGADEYYVTRRAQHANAQNKTLLRWMRLVLNSMAGSLFLTQPLLIVAGDKAESRWHSEKMFKLLNGKNKDSEKIAATHGFL